MSSIIPSESGSPFHSFVEELVAKYDDQLFNSGPEEQTAAALRAMERLNRIAPISSVADTDIDLAGFGTAPLLYAAGDSEYLLLSDVADQLGWFMPRAHEWAQMQSDYAVADQRRIDEEREDGRLGWEYMRDYVHLNIELVIDDPEAKPDANGRCWSAYSDWLINKARLPWLMSCSPWGREFVDNTMDAFGFIAKRAWPGLRDVATYGPDGEPTGGNAYDDMFKTGLTEDEAIRKARRGPVVEDDEDGAR